MGTGRSATRDAAAVRRGGGETRRRRDAAAERRGGGVTRRRGDAATVRRGGGGTWRRAGAAGRRGGSGTWWRWDVAAERRGKTADGVRAFSPGQLKFDAPEKVGPPGSRVSFFRVGDILRSARRPVNDPPSTGGIQTCGLTR